MPGTPGATWTAVAVANQHVCGLDSNGTVWCKGQADGAQLGAATGLTTCPYPGSAFTVACRLTFAPIAGTDKYVQIAAGGEFTCGVTTTSALKCWGRMYQTVYSSPLAVGPQATGWKAVSVSEDGMAVCAVRTDGTAWCFGRYQLGGSSMLPHQVTMPGQAVAVSVGGNHACAWATDGTAWCWGDKLSGNFGDGTDDHTYTNTPVQVSAPYKN